MVRGGLIGSWLMGFGVFGMGRGSGGGGGGVFHDGRHSAKEWGLLAVVDW